MPAGLFDRLFTFFHYPISDKCQFVCFVGPEKMLVGLKKKVVFVCFCF